mmetsp:Transcript_15155/g.32889  ORF Transcript_15155/g.32889 Transcript_15155/m.32889 type:complete len:789 (-) Transcript_15155:2051-4417(-)
MPSAFTRLFGPARTDERCVALCIGDFTYLSKTQPAEVSGDFEAPKSGIADPTATTTSTSKSRRFSKDTQAKFKAFIHNLIPGSGENSASTTADSGGRAVLRRFLKTELLFQHTSFICTADESAGKEKVLSRLKSFFKGTTASIVLVYYCGLADERGNWALGPDQTSIISFRELSMLWQKHRKHSQHLVLLLDAPYSGCWVQALRCLSKAEQLELSLCIQASDNATAGVEALPAYTPGAFTLSYIRHNTWREGGHPECWPPGICPTFYSTWLNTSLVEFGVRLKFFSTAAQDLLIPIPEARRRSCSLLEASPRSAVHYNSGPVNVPPGGLLNAASPRRHSSLIDHPMNSQQQISTGPGPFISHRTGLGEEAPATEYLMSQPPLPASPGKGHSTEDSLSCVPRSEGSFSAMSDTPAAAWDSNKRRESEFGEVHAGPPAPNAPAIHRKPTRSYTVIDRRNFDRELQRLLVQERDRQDRKHRRFEMDGDEGLDRILDDNIQDTGELSRFDSAELPLAAQRAGSGPAAMALLNTARNSVATPQVMSALASLTSNNMSELLQQVVMGRSSRLARMTTRQSVEPSPDPLQEVLHGDLDARAMPHHLTLSTLPSDLAVLTNMDSTSSCGAAPTTGTPRASNNASHSAVQYARRSSDARPFSPRLSPFAAVAGEQEGVGSPSMISNHLLRYVLYQNSEPNTPRGSLMMRDGRPGRLQMAGSEASSMLFNDDEERYAALKEMMALRPDLVNKMDPDLIEQLKDIEAQQQEGEQAAAAAWAGADTDANTHTDSLAPSTI